MVQDYIRRDISTEISEEGGSFIQFVNKATYGSDTTVREAREKLFVVGDKSMIAGYFTGVLRSIVEGIELDGHPRSLGGLITFYPVCTGEIDLENGWNPLVNGVGLRLRLQNDVEFDIKDWSFRDVTPGLVPFVINHVSDGEVDGRVTSNRNVQIDGDEFPLGEKLTIGWVCGAKSGTVARASVSGDISRISFAASQLTGLDASDDGKEIVFTLKGNFCRASREAVYRYVAPVVAPTFTDVTQDGHDADELAFGESEYVVNGASLKESGDTYRLDLTEPGGGVCLLAADFNEADSTAAQLKFTKLTNNSSVETASWVGKTAKFTIVRGGVEYTHNVTIVAS